jgi:hypothetical protein
MAGYIPNIQVVGFSRLTLPESGGIKGAVFIQKLIEGIGEEDFYILVNKEKFLNSLKETMQKVRTRWADTVIKNMGFKSGPVKTRINDLIEVLKGKENTFEHSFVEEESEDGFISQNHYVQQLHTGVQSYFKSFGDQVARIKINQNWNLMLEFSGSTESFDKFLNQEDILKTIENIAVNSFYDVEEMMNRAQEKNLEKALDKLMTSNFKDNNIYGIQQKIKKIIVNLLSEEASTPIVSHSIELTLLANASNDFNTYEQNFISAESLKGHLLKTISNFASNKHEYSLKTVELI